MQEVIAQAPCDDSKLPDPVEADLPGLERQPTQKEDRAGGATCGKGWRRFIVLARSLRLNQRINSMGRICDPTDELNILEIPV